MKKLLFRIATAPIFFLLTFSVFADNSSPLEADALVVVNAKLRDIEWITQQKLVVEAVTSQNQQGLTRQEILRLDEEWRSTPELTPLKLSLQSSGLGVYLKKLVGDGRVFSELFVTDNQGANVAAFPATSDYWQGDEEKWLAVFPSKNFFVSEAAFDQSSQTNAVQISVPILKEGEIIGVLVAGIKMNFVEYKVARRLKARTTN